MADAAISFAVQKLGDFVIQKVKFLQDFEEEVRLLKTELKRMQCFLKDAGEKQADDERIRNWISEIREVAQDAEDVIETFDVRVDTPRRNRGLLRRWVCLPNVVYNQNKIGEQIKNLQARLKTIDQARERYGIRNLGEGMVTPKKWENIVERPPWQKDKQVVGMKKDVESLLSRAILEGKKKGVSFAGIVGMPGIGKSTLARTVYNHNKVIGRFDCRAWAVVSSEFRAKEVMKELVQQLMRPSEDELKILKTMEKSEMPRLQEMLYQRLKGKRYLIVLDDVWDNQHWESLTRAFPVEDKGSVLLLTSRSKDILSRGGFVHYMKKLDPEESWELFLQKALSGNTKTGSKFPQELKKIGKEILKKCDGLPLAITVVGGLVAKHRHSTNTELDSFLKAMNFQLGRSDCGVAAILELSYNNLPAELKACFLCLGFFKEDEPIRAKRLMHTWIAQGLVSREGRKETVEEIASGYLDELINRSMIEVKERGAGNRVKHVIVHDLLRDLSIAKAKEEIRFEIERDEAGSSSQYLDKPRHRAMYCNGERSSYKNLASRNKRIRSLVFHGSPGGVDLGKSFLKSFKLLRVLDFEDFGLRKLSDAIGAMISLRYLGLRNNKLKELPDTLGHLKNLQILDIAKNLFIQLPNVIWKLQSLRHLFMSQIKCKVPLKIESLKHLQTVTYIPLANLLLKNHKKMTSLHKLGIELETDSNLMDLCALLANLKNLACLNLRLHGFKSMASLDKLIILHRLTRLKLRGPLNTLPSASYFPPNLSCLSLVGTWLDEDPMPVLEMLPKLCYLKLDCAYKGEKMVVSRDGFPMLEVLSIYGLFKLGEIKVKSGGMPRIKQLEINKCLDLKSLPSELRLISNL
ncbi:hypothetical protein ACS0TY_004911 [Phlomoides rotata]